MQGHLQTFNYPLSIINCQLSTVNYQLIIGKSIIADKSYAFALRIIKLYKFLKVQYKEYDIIRQMLRSGTAIGALVKEAEHAQSRADFINKMNIALKEANETEYWLCLLKDSGYLDEKAFLSIHTDCTEILRMLISIVKTSKDKS